MINGPGSVFPIPFFIDQQQVRMDYMALTRVSMRKANLGDFYDFVSTSVEAQTLLIRLATQLLKIYGERLETLSLTRSYDRLTRRLNHLVDLFGVSNDDGRIMIPIPLTQEDLAGSINATRETTSRHLGQMVVEGIISYSNRCLIIDPNKLNMS